MTTLVPMTTLNPYATNEPLKEKEETSSQVRHEGARVFEYAKRTYST